MCSTKRNKRNKEDESLNSWAIYHNKPPANRNATYENRDVFYMKLFLFHLAVIVALAFYVGPTALRVVWLSDFGDTYIQMFLMFSGFGKPIKTSHGSGLLDL